MLTHGSSSEDCVTFVQFNSWSADPTRWCEIPIEPGVTIVYGPGSLHTAINHEPADSEVPLLGVIARNDIRDINEEHHVVLERPQRECCGDGDAGDRESDSQHSLLPGFHCLSSSALMRTSISRYTRL